MSYCRWSSMDFRCDLYCYEHVDGTYTTHVAGNRVVSPVIPSPSWRLLKPGLIVGFIWSAWYRLHMWSVTHGIRRRIDHKHAGETFKDDSLQTFKMTLLMLRAEGFIFPDDVLATVDAEMRIEAAQRQST